MNFDPQRNDLIRDFSAENRRKAQAARQQPAQPPAAKPAVSKPAAAPQPAAKPAVAPPSGELKRLRGKVADQEAKLQKLRAIAVEMSKRSARMSNVPGYVLKNYADELLKQLGN